MAAGDPASEPRRLTPVERRAQRIALSPYVSLGLALTFLAVSAISAVVIRLVDQHDFHSLGSAFWWAVQTVTTVGYGDVVPTTTVGRIVGGLEMVVGVSFIAFLTAGVTSVTIRREHEELLQEFVTPAGTGGDDAILGALVEIRQSIADLDQRLARIESRPGT